MRAEGTYGTIKQYLSVLNGDLYTILEKLALLLSNQHSEHKAAMAAACNRTPQTLRISIFEAVIGHVTPYALWRVYDQKKLLDRGLQDTYM